MVNSEFVAGIPLTAHDSLLTSHHSPLTSPIPKSSLNEKLRASFRMLRVSYLLYLTKLNHNEKNYYTRTHFICIDS